MPDHCRNNGKERLVLALDLIAEDIKGLPENGASLIRQRKRSDKENP